MHSDTAPCAPGNAGRDFAPKSPTEDPVNATGAAGPTVQDTRPSTRRPLRAAHAG
jgi:hypothetical protein